MKAQDTPYAAAPTSALRKALSPALLAFIGLALLWGASFLFIKIGVTGMPPDALVATRLTIAALVLLGVARASGERLPRGWKIWRDFAVTGVVGLAIPFSLITWGEQEISSGMASILNGTTPLFTALIAYFWMRGERFSPLKLFGLVLGFVGVVVAVGLENLTIGNNLLSHLAVMGAAFCYGVSGIYTRRAFAGIPARTVAVGQFVCAAVALLPVALLRHGLPTQLPPAGPLGAVVALALFCTAVAYILYYWLIEHIGATRTSMVTYMVTPLALIYGAAILREPVYLNTIAGLLLVVLGILLANGVIGRRSA